MRSEIEELLHNLHTRPQEAPGGFVSDEEGSDQEEGGNGLEELG